MASRSRFRFYLFLLGFNAVVLLLLLAAAELLYRRHKISRTVFESVPYMEYDDHLGWVPRPGRYPCATITPDRFRKIFPPNGSSSGPTVLACGDSFTYGSGVSAGESWPDFLAAATGWRVINAGVSGYGLDQVVLRLEKVIAEIRPDLVIISMIDDDVRRCELSRRGRHKPYFTIVDGSLVLHNQPVPSPVDLPRSSKWWERSILLKDLLGLLGIAGSDDPDMVRVHREGLEVTRLLCERAQQVVRDHGARLYMVIQPARAFLERGEIQNIQSLVKLARSLGIPVLNLWYCLESDFMERESVRRSLFIGHMSPEGNRWAAEKIRKFLVAHEAARKTGRE